MKETQRGWPEGRSPSGEAPYMKHSFVRQQLFRSFPPVSRISRKSEGGSETGQHRCRPLHYRALYGPEAPDRKASFSILFKELSNLGRSHSLPAPRWHKEFLPRTEASAIRLSAAPRSCLPKKTGDHREGAYDGGFLSRQPGESGKRLARPLPPPFWRWLTPSSPLCANPRRWPLRPLPPRRSTRRPLLCAVPRCGRWRRNM